MEVRTKPTTKQVVAIYNRVDTQQLYLLISLCHMHTHTRSFYLQLLAVGCFADAKVYAGCVYTVSLERHSAIQRMFTQQHTIAGISAKFSFPNVIVCNATRWVSGCPQPFTVSHLADTHLYAITVSLAGLCKKWDDDVCIVPVSLFVHTIDAMAFDDTSVIKPQARL